MDDIRIGLLLVDIFCHFEMKSVVGLAHGRIACPVDENVEWGDVGHPC